MGKNIVPYLCGGTFFILIRRAGKITDSKRNRLKGKCDAIHDRDVLLALLQIVHPDAREGDSFVTYTSRFKNCKEGVGEELEFKDQDVLRKFRERMENEYGTLRKKALDLCNSYIDTGKREQLVKQLIELIDDDQSIGPEDCFWIDDRRGELNKEALLEVTEVSLPDFLLSVWFFVVTKHSDNEKGRSIVEKWFSSKKNRDIGDSGKRIKHDIKVWCVDDEGDRERATDTVILKENRISEEVDSLVPGLFVLNDAVVKAHRRERDSNIVRTYLRISAEMEHILYAVCSGVTEECVLENREATLVDCMEQEIRKEKQAVFLLGNGGIGKTTALVQTAVRAYHFEKTVYLFQLGKENDTQLIDMVIDRIALSKKRGEERKYVLFIDSPCNNGDGLKRLLSEIQYNENVQVIISERLNRFELVMEDVLPELYLNTAEIILPMLRSQRETVGNTKIDGGRILKYRISPEWKRQVVLNMFRSVPGVDISTMETLVREESKLSVIESYLRTCIAYNKLVDEGKMVATACKVKLDWDEWDDLVDKSSSQLEAHESRELHTLFSITAALDIFKVKTRIGLLERKMRIARTRLDSILRSMLSTVSNEPVIYENGLASPYVKLKHDVVSILYFEVKKLNPQVVLEELIDVFDEETVIDFEKRVFKRKYMQGSHKVPFDIDTGRLYGLFKRKTGYYEVLLAADRSYSFDVAGVWMQEAEDKQMLSDLWESLLKDYFSYAEKAGMRRKVLACCRDDCNRRNIPVPKLLSEVSGNYENALQVACEEHDRQKIARAWREELLRIYQSGLKKWKLISEWIKIIFDYLIYGFDMPDEFVKILEYEDYQVIDAAYFNLRGYVKRNRLDEERYYRLGIVLYGVIAGRQSEDIPSRMHLAYCYTQCNELLQAETIYRDLIKQGAGFRQYSALGSLCVQRLKAERESLRNNVEERMKLEEVCERSFQSAIEGAESDRDKAIAYGALGWFLFTAKGRYEESYCAFHKALKYREIASIHCELGMLCCCYQKRNKYYSIEEAIHHFEKALELLSRTGLERLSLYVPYASMWYCLGEYDQAVELYRMAAKLGEQNADRMLERIERERKTLKRLKERPLRFIMTLEEAYQLTEKDKSVFGDEEKRNDIFTLLLNFVSREEKSAEEVRYAVRITLNLSRSTYRQERDLVRYRIVQQVETLAMEYDINREMAEKNFRAQCFFISKSIKHRMDNEYKLNDYEMI